MELLLLIFVVSLVVAARAVITLLWSRLGTEPPGPWEASAATTVTAFIIAIGVSWLLSWCHLLNRTGLLAATVALLGAGLLPGRLHERPPGSAGRPRLAKWSLLALTPLLLWIAFVSWRGQVVPVLSHDALAYHMPKAVMIAQANRYEYFNSPDPRVSTSPCNYELLLADVLLLTGSDAVTEWIGTASYLALLLLAGAVAERWWGKGAHIVVTVLLTSAVPVILLHAGAHKNDLLSNVLYLAALFWGGRWLVSQETMPLLLTLASLATAGGTKLQAVFPTGALLMVALWLLARRQLRVSAKQLLIMLCSFPVAVVFLGGWAYFANILYTGQAALPASASSDAGYGDWTNLIEVPLLILMRPFGAGIFDLYVPWRDERWFWPRYELYFSDYGILITLLVLAVPFAFARYAGRGSSSIRRERILASVAALLAFLLMLPIRIRPVGFFAGFPRYFSFIVVFVIAWTATPVVRELMLRRRKSLVLILTGACAALLVALAATYTINDAFQPLSYVGYAARHDDLRTPYFTSNRAGLIVDQIAGPTDTIAFHGGFDSWTYPAYGKELKRDIRFIDAGDPIPRDAKFVVIDRAWNILWGDPRFEHMGQYQEYLAHGRPTAEDLAVVRRLFAEKQGYAPLYFMPDRNQAVFIRRDAGEPPPRVVVPDAGS